MSSKPQLSQPDVQRIPEELKQLRQWVSWNYDEGDTEDRPWVKVPKNPHNGANASVSAPGTWGTIEQALEASKKYDYSGIGFVFTDDDPYVGIDLDKHFDPKTREFSALARSIMESVPTYTEFSASGTGIHLILKGKIPGSRRRNDKLHIEMYEAGRWFAWSSNLVPNMPVSINEAQDVLDVLYDRAFPNAPVRTGTSTEISPGEYPPLADDEILRLVRKSAIAAKFEELWSGVADANGGYSGGDLALCSILAFWATDPRQVDRLFQQSGRMRSKWTEHRGAKTYGDMTVEKAWASQTDHYESSQLVTLTRKSRIEESKIVTESSEGILVEEIPEEGKTQEGVPDSNNTDLWDVAEIFATLYKDQWVYDTANNVWRTWCGTHYQEEPHKPSSPNIKLLRLARRVLRLANLDITGSARVDEAIRQAAASTGRPFPATEGLINFMNGTLNLSSGTLHPHTREDNLISCLPFSYQRGTYPTITKFLEETMDDREEIEAYMTHLGLALMGDVLVHKMIVLLGPPRSGKSTLLQLANATCGQDPKSDGGHQILSTDVEGMRSRATWGTRRVVTMEELPGDSFRNENIVKTLTAHGGAQQRGMYESEKLQNRWRPKLIASSNESPRYTDRSGALSARMVIIKCPHSRLGQPLNLLLFDHMKPEIEGFAYDCIQLGQKCLVQGGAYPQSQRMREALEEIEIRGNALKGFVEDHCVFDQGSWIALDTFYTSYCNYCEESGNHPLSKDKLAASLCEGFNGQVHMKERRKNASGQMSRGFRGIKVLPQKLQMETP